ncbi:Protein chain release factor A [Candidatus Phytoplasma australiense]|uniref:Peptide chain release factor 1 n=1 Tax=Phytoplasma australiense TaxID=59748 RepID=RF1_PHYAS|nr:RecName: Full=Peptide chain release factor 1; Short=RF-1 [Candidatus Phytoplasma australiense]CAM11482.1 Protein chain release factor A [Candidatus Phytoplasma australiense]
MLARLKKIQQKYQNLQQDLLQNQSISNKINIFKNLSKLEPIVELFQQYLTLEEQLTNITKALNQDQIEDKEILELAQKEKETLSQQKKVLWNQLRILLLPQDPEDQKNVILEIKGAVGGNEANLFAADLLRTYMKYAESKKWKVEILNLHPSIKGGLSSVELLISGQNIYSFLKYESGVHRVQRVPATEVQGRIHTSTAIVLVLPEAKEVEIKIDWNDIRTDTFNSSGPGGQSVNTTKSAVRLSHLPSGISVACQEGKSQHENKEKAFTLLKARIYNQILNAKQEAENKHRKSLVGTGDRSEKIRTYNYPQNRITDHRIGLTLQKLDIIMEGKLDFIIEPLIDATQKEKLVQSE